ncbi:protein kinase domain-containing protein [Roseimaritima ulvae]|uniref:non-specific serine/threonine protein kinase n=1 Tax=Roseimaritima ulvae TaxID=980254 RepID=A0A5B9R647_9BACT|nr:protein kinase [Roseimaritima ulvae]QEG41713.1 Serine/threonine-protein kinase PknB [Roseimaritima ulvae]
MKSSTVCLSESEIPRLLAGDLPADEITAAEDHIADCESCRSAIESMIADSRWWDDARQSLAQKPTGDFDHSQNEPSGDANEPDPTASEQLLDLLGPTDDPAMLGRIGTYEIVGVLGRGGMGAVFKGYDGALNRFVAIKMLLPHLAVSGAARKRFEREAQAAAAVVDDHVMAIHGVSEWKSVPYFVMPYARGVSLQKRLNDSGPLEVREVLRIGMQAAKGLAAAHAQGLVHRDVKPANIFLDEGVERVQLMDFGLARAVDDASLTRSGTLAGTPQYMSPEQARAETVDSRSDLFSLGSVLYAMCTGHAPFRAESSYSVLRLITDKEPRPIRELNPDIPDWLCAIVGKLMSKQACDRFESAEQVAELLEACLAHVQQPTTTPLPAGVQALAAQEQRVGVQALAAQEQRPSTLKRLKAGLQQSSTLKRLKAGLQRMPPIAKRFVAVGFAFSLVFAGVMIVLELNKGTLTIESELDDVAIRIVKEQETVKQLTVNQSGATVRIAAGNYVVIVDGEVDGIAVEDGQVSLRRGEHEVAKIVRVQPPEKASPAASLNAQASPVPNDPASQALADLQAEYQENAAAYRHAMDEATDEAELNRVYQEMDPRQTMPAKLLAFEAKHRGSKAGLTALTEVARMAVSVGDPTSEAARGRVEAVKRLTTYYLDHRGLEKIAAGLDAGPFVPGTDEFLQLLVEKSPHRETQAEALIAQVIQGMRLLRVESQLPTLIAQQKQTLHNDGDIPPAEKAALLKRLTEFENVNFRKLRAELNQKLQRLVDDYADQPVQHYGTGSVAGLRLAHAINQVIVGKKAPQITATDVTGKPFRLSDLREKLVVLLFAQNVGDDYTEMYGPIRQLVAKYEWAPVRFVTIVSTDDQKGLRAAVQRGDLNGTVIAQPLYQAPLSLDWGIEAYPSVYIIDANGVLHPEMHMPYYGAGGYDTSEVDNRIAELLKPSPQAMPNLPVENGGNKFREEGEPNASDTSIGEHLSLSDSVKAFNQKFKERFPHSDQPPLTEQELIACASWRVQYDTELSESLKSGLHEIARKHQMPAGWKFAGGFATRPVGETTVDLFQISLANDSGTERIIVRERFLGSSASDAKPADEPTSGTPLARAVHRFNARHKKADGQIQPPLTEDEVIAAIIHQQTKRDALDVSDSLFANLQDIARTRLLPEGAELELISSFGSEAGTEFTIWSIRLKMLQDEKGREGWTYGFGIREQFIGVRHGDAASIHWGPPGENGLQAGVRLTPGLLSYEMGQKIGVEFFYRNILGQSLPATIPNIFIYKEIDVRDAEGAKLEVVKGAQDLIIGGAVGVNIGEEPYSFRGQPLMLVPVSTAAEQRDKIFAASDARTLILANPGQSCKLTFMVRNSADDAEGTLKTGEIRFDVAEGTIEFEQIVPRDFGRLLTPKNLLGTGSKRTPKAATNAAFATPESLMEYYADCQFRNDTGGCLACYSDKVIDQFAANYLVTATGVLEMLRGGGEPQRKRADQLEALLERSMIDDPPSIAAAALYQAAGSVRDELKGGESREPTQHELVLTATSPSMLKNPRQFVLEFSQFCDED